MDGADEKDDPQLRQLSRVLEEPFVGKAYKRRMGRLAAHLLAESDDVAEQPSGEGERRRRTGS